MSEVEERARVSAVNQAVYEAVVTRGKDGATVKDLEEESIQVVWPGSRAPRLQELLRQL